MKQVSTNALNYHASAVEAVFKADRSDLDNDHKSHVGFKKQRRSIQLFGSSRTRQTSNAAIFVAEEEVDCAFGECFEELGWAVSHARSALGHGF